MVPDYQIPWWRVDYGTEVIKAVSDCAEQKRFSMGEVVRTFETQIEELLNIKKCIAVGSGSDALLMSLMALGVSKGSKVMLQDRIWIAAANALGILGAEVILVDIDIDSGCISLSDLEKKYTEDVSGLVLVEMNGKSPDINLVREFCVERGIFLLEDAAQALGSKNERFSTKFLGTFGEIGCFSLSTAKIIGAGQGGFCVTDDEALADLLTKTRLHGNDQVFAPTWERLGFNFRLTDIHASIALSQLPKLEVRKERLKDLHRLYNDLLAGNRMGRLIPVCTEVGEVGPYIEFILRKAEDRTRLISSLGQQGIEIRPFYPSVSDASKYMDIVGDTPVAKSIISRGVYLPSGPDMPFNDVERVANAILNLT